MLQTLAAIEAARRSRCRHDKIHIAIVKLIHQGDEATRCVLPSFVKNGNVADEHGLIIARYLDVISGTAWALAERGKIEPRDLVAGSHHWNLPALDLDEIAVLRLAVGQVAKQSLEPA